MMIGGTQEARMKLKVLQRVDPYIISILACTTNTAYYAYNREKSEWEQQPFEGSLYLYRRQKEPFYGFQIMNRLGPEILVETLDKDFDLDLEIPYLLYNKPDGQIICIWIPLEEECKNVHKKMKAIIDELQLKTTKKKIDNKKKEESEENVDNLFNPHYNQSDQKTSISPSQSSTNAAVLDLVTTKSCSMSQTTTPLMSNSKMVNAGTRSSRSIGSKSIDSTSSTVKIAPKQGSISPNKTILMSNSNIVDPGTNTVDNIETQLGKLDIASSSSTSKKSNDETLNFKSNEIQPGKLDLDNSSSTPLDDTSRTPSVKNIETQLSKIDSVSSSSTNRESTDKTPIVKSNGTQPSNLDLDSSSSLSQECIAEIVPQESTNDTVHQESINDKVRQESSNDNKLDFIEKPSSVSPLVDPGSILEKLVENLDPNCCSYIGVYPYKPRSTPLVSNEPKKEDRNNKKTRNKGGIK